METAGGQDLLEARGPQVGKGDAGKAAIGEVPEPALQEVIDRQSRKAALSGVTPGCPACRPRREIDRGQSQLADLAQQFVTLSAGR